MIRARFLRILCIALLAVGAAQFVYAQRERPRETPSFLLMSMPEPESSALKPVPADAPPPQAAPAGERPAASGLRAPFEIDVSALATKLDELRFDEREEQIADWTVYGTLLQAGLSAEDLRQATYDQPVFRNPALVETLRFEYGPGRRVVMPDGEVWLFYSWFDRERRTAILARLADQVRMELGEKPGGARVFQYRSDVAQGVIRVHPESDVLNRDLYGPAYGYVEARVRTGEEFAAWLDAVDDVVHMKPLGPGEVRFGGRRLADARTPGASLDDVAALYQAHAELRLAREALEAGARKALQPLNDAWSALIDDYNAKVERFNANNRALLSESTLQSKYDALLAVLEDTDQDGPDDADEPGLDMDEFWRRLRERREREGLPAFGEDDSLRRALEELERDRLPPVRLPDPWRPGTGGSAGKSMLDRWSTNIDRVRPRVEAQFQALQGAYYADARRHGRIAPDDPGFSLDPMWDTEGLVEDLDRMVSDPGLLVEGALALVRDAALHPPAEDCTPIAVWAARNVAVAFLGESAQAWRPPAGMAGAITQVAREIEKTTAREAADTAAVPFLQLKSDVGKRQGEAESLEALDRMRLSNLLEYIEATRRFQQARYDGPLQGTHVGMVLFYTDVMAKIWCSVDYAGSAPVEEALGFQSKPRTSRYVEPEYWEEMWALPSTRIWFGAKQEGYAATSDARTLNLAHIATRVYSAGSNLLGGGEEEEAAESSRRAYGWWDRHFARVADHEPQFHIQNQIMKWSVLTGWLLEKDLGDWLHDVEVDRSHRFDRWYRSTPELRYRGELRLLPPDRWLGGTEAMEILHSYTFPGGGTESALITGGVSLGSARSVETGTKVTSTVPRALRRPGLEYTGASRQAVKTLKGTEFALPDVRASGPALTRIKPHASARFRAGPTALDVKRVTTEVERSAGRGSLRLRSDLGGLGGLEARTTSAGTSLRWRTGGVEGDVRTVTEAARAHALGGPEAAGRRLAGQSTFLPTEGGYVVVEGQSVRAVRRAPGTEADTVVRVGHQDAVRADAGMVRASHVDPARGGGATPSRAALDTSFEGDAVLRAVSEAPYQRLRPLTGRADRSVAGHVERVFTSERPPAGSEGFRLRTGIEGLPEVRAWVANDTLILRRPPGGSPTLFNDLATQGGVRGLDVAEVAARRPADGAVVRLGGAHRTADAGTRTARAILEGDARTALDALHTSAREGRLGEAVEATRRALPREELGRLATGNESAAARRILSDTATTPESLIGTALRQARRGDAAKACETVEASLRAGRTDAATLDAAVRAASDLGHADVATYLRARGGLVDGLSPEMSQRLSLVPSGRRPVLRLEVPDAATRVPLGTEARGRILESFRGNEVHVEGRGRLSSLDWDAAPGPSAAKVVGHKRVRWTAVQVDGLGGLRPSQLVLEGRVFEAHRLAARERAGPPGPFFLLLGLAGDGGDDDDDDSEDEEDETER